jgi:hypothetical protein
MVSGTTWKTALDSSSLASVPTDSLPVFLPFSMAFSFGFLAFFGLLVVYHKIFMDFLPLFSRKNSLVMF